MDAVIIHTWIPGQEAHGLSLNQFPELQLYFCQQQQPQHRLKMLLPSGWYISLFRGLLYSQSAFLSHVAPHASSCAIPSAGI